MMSIINRFPKSYDIERNKVEKDLESNTMNMTTLRLKLSTRFESLEDWEEDNYDDKEESAITGQDEAPK